MGMRQICSDYHSRHVSIHESAPEAMDFAIPKPVLLARYPDSWKQRPSRERDLERAVRKFSIESFAFGKSMRRQGQETSIQYDTETFITELALEFEVPITRIQTMFSYFIRLLEDLKNQILKIQIQMSWIISDGQNLIGQDFPWHSAYFNNRNSSQPAQTQLNGILLLKFLINRKVRQSLDDTV